MSNGDSATSRYIGKFECMAPFDCRWYGRILRDLIEKDMKERKEEEQSGFRAGRSCTDNVFCLKQVIEKWNHGNAYKVCGPSKSV